MWRIYSIPVDRLPPGLLMYNRIRSPSPADLYTAKCSIKSSGCPISPCRYRLYSVKEIVFVITWLGRCINISLIPHLLLIYHGSLCILLLQDLVSLSDVAYIHKPLGKQAHHRTF